MIRDFDQAESRNNFLLAQAAVKGGWTMVNYIELETKGSCIHYEAWQWNHEEADVIYAWCHNNCQGEWREFAAKFYFEDEKDAVLFTLRWA